MTILPPKHVYLHLPYCASKCPYCDFFSMPASALPPAERYVDALLRDLADVDGDFETVYVGGGSPTSLSSDALARLLARVASRLAPGAEFTVETNPADLDDERAALLARSGVNRVSIGIQSMSDAALEFLGRRHRTEENERAFEIAKRHGFRSICGDVIFGFPGDDYEQTARFLIERGAHHVSAYELTIEGNSRWNREKVDPSDEDEVKAEKFARLSELFESNGLMRYEISNFARRGFECRSHRNVWSSGEYVGIGAGAHGYEDGIRYAVTNDMDAYSRSCEREVAPSGNLAMETALIGMRMTAGIDLEELDDQHREAIENAWPSIERLIDDGYVSRYETRLIPTKKCLLFLNDIAGYFHD